MFHDPHRAFGEPTNPERQNMVTDAVLKTLVFAYTPPDDRSKRRVYPPQREAYAALLTAMAELLATVPGRKERNDLIGLASPLIGEAVNRARTTDSLILPEEQRIILPNGG